MQLDQLHLKWWAEQEENLRRLKEENDYDVVLPIEIDPVLPMSTDSAENWGYAFMQIPKIEAEWKDELRRRVVYGVIDTAYKFTHPALAPYSHNEYGRIFSDDKEESHGDGHGHGHHCGGIIAANPKDGRRIGVSPARYGFAKAIPVGGLNARGGGRIEWLRNSLSYLVNLYLDKFKKQGAAFVISNSWGTMGQTGDKQFDELVAAAKKEGVFITASAGNRGFRQGESTVGWPASNPLITAIGSLDENGSPSSFSSAGPELWASTPGRRILSTYKNGGWAFMSGTSMANPLFAGLQGWFLSRFPQIDSSEVLDQFIKEHITDIFQKGFDVRTGFGTPLLTRYAGKEPPVQDPEEPQRPEIKEAVVTFEDLAFEFRNAILGESRYNYAKPKIHRARLRISLPLKYPAGKFASTQRTLHERFRSFVMEVFDDMTFASWKDEHFKEEARDIIRLKKDEVGYVEIAEYLHQTLSKFTNTEIFNLEMIIEDGKGDTGLVVHSARL